MGGTIDQLIINSPWDEPERHWRYERESRTFSLEPGRRPAGYVVATPGSKAFDDPGVFRELPEVNRIRPRVKAWRDAGYPGVTGTTRRLLEHWRDPELFEERRFFFCQLEAIETLIWLTEAPEGDRQGITVRGDGGPFERICAKMATGAGKTLAMAMAIAWQVLNRVANPQDARFAKQVLVVAPGLTVRKRLAVLEPSDPGNYYDRFNMVPSALRERMRQGGVRVLVRNWHTLNWESDEQVARKRGVDKRGAKSDAAYVREVLGDMASASNILVINDEAHHAWRVPAAKLKGVTKADVEEATRWIGGLDRIHRARGILRCYDFSATPFAPSGRESTEEALFDWIVSDFSLNDAIESGLVKTPRVVVRDDGVPAASNYRSKLYHINQWVRDDLNRKAEAHEPLPDLVVNAYYLLGKDWLETARGWAQVGLPTPPVMITVANRTETAARVHHAFTHGKVRIDELADAERTLHIDSRVLERAEARDDTAVTDDLDDDVDDDDEERPARRLTKQEQAERLRVQVDTVGQLGKAGERIQNVISVGMLTEGWDARTVTHIMGLRAFSSQLLCEQVVGRGLRRTSYEIDPESGRFPAEHVNIFGIPFTFLPHEGGDAVVPPPPPPKSRIEAVPDKRAFETTWPNVVRIEHTWTPRLTLDMAAVTTLQLDATETPTLAQLAPVVEGKPDVSRITEIDLDSLARRFRMQTIVFETARDVFDQMAPTWRGTREVLIAQLVPLVERFLASDRVTILPAAFGDDAKRRRILLTLNMSKIVRHLWGAIRDENTTALTPVFDSERPIRSTGDMLPWFTGRPWADTQRSHVNRCVYDSAWEASEAFALDRHPGVEAWVKNDHLGFEIVYVFDGAVRKYRLDFIIRLTTGTTLILEVKGQDSPQSEAKRRALDEWTRAVTDHGGFGRWAWAVSRKPGDLADRIAEALER